MGNLLLIVIFAIFTFFVAYFSSRLSLGICLFVKQKRPALPLRKAWHLSLTLNTSSVLMAFLVFGLCLPWLLSVLFENVEAASSSVMALGMLASLCLAWLWSLNRSRVALNELDWAQDETVRG